MSSQLGESLRLVGAGGAYIRVSTDQQDTERQFAAVRSFEQRHGVAIRKEHWFKDEGWARDEADERPDFQRLMRMAESGAVKWIVVDALDRFGTKNAKQLISYLYDLEEASCKLYDVSGKEWTGEDIGTTIHAVVEGDKSKGEQTSKSRRVLGGKIAKARRGEWQGGPVRLGFDVACYHRETDKELWRVVFVGLHKRLKVYADGRTERFDGKDNFPKWQNEGKPSPEFLRLVPTRDKAKVDAAASVFKRFATESISATALGHHLNKLGFRMCYGGPFQSHHVESMLADPIYLGYYTYNRRHFGKFHRFTGEQVVEELNYAQKQTKNDRADWVQSKRLFRQLVDQKTWDAVQRKLERRTKRTNAPRSAAQFLAGLVYCGNCGHRMMVGSTRKPTKNPRMDGSTGDRYEYFCGTYFKAVREGTRQECKCLRNGVFQDTLEEYVGRYLDETGQRLEQLTSDLDADALTEMKQKELHSQHETFVQRMMEMLDYIAANDPEGWEKMWAPIPESQDVPVERAIEYYRRCFDADREDGRLAELEAEHDKLTQQCLNVKTERAIAKVNQQLAQLETEIGCLEKQRQNVADIVEREWREILDVADAIAEAKHAMKSESGERALRHRAEALRAIILRIECTFTATGRTGGGWGKKNAELATVTIYPVVGDSAEFSSSSEGTLMYSSAHSRMKRTRFGRMR